MRFRLFKQGRRPPLLALGFASLGCFALGAACSGKEFTSGSSAGAGGSAGTAGGSDSEGGEGGDGDGVGGTSNGDRGGTSSNAGSAGKTSAGCDCKANEYCQDAIRQCQPCANYSRLEFGTPQKLLAQSTQSSERFPRPAGSGSPLFYVAGAADNSRIFYAATPLSGAGTSVTPAGQIESGPIFARSSSEQNLYFDRTEAGERKLYTAVWTTAATRTKEALMPEPINAPGYDDYSVAISPSTGHVYWMSTRDGKAELWWQPTRMSDSTPPAPLELKLKIGKVECPRTGEDATPWVNASGTLLLFRNPSLNEKCEPNDSGATDLFAVPLNDDGTPQGAASPLSSLNNTGGMSQETDPSLSVDSCTIYFASDNGSGDFDLYKAARN